MPRRDGTGPVGTGSRTAQGMGACGGSRNGQGLGNGRGNGLGYGAQLRAKNNFAPIQQNELLMLKHQADQLESTLTNVKERISELEQK
jgi:hypothetical protein